MHLSIVSPSNSILAGMCGDNRRFSHALLTSGAAFYVISVYMAIHTALPETAVQTEVVNMSCRNLVYALMEFESIKTN